MPHPGTQHDEPPTEDDDECSMCGGTGELRATLEDGTREEVACPACLQRRLEAQLAAAQQRASTAEASAAWMRLACKNLYSLLKDGQITQAIAEVKAIPEDTDAGQKILDTLKAIHTISLELTTQSRVSAAEPGAKIAALCAEALGWTDGKANQ